MLKCNSADTITVGCKVNLGLRILGRREDGYHTIDSLFWPLANPHDTLRITSTPHSGLRVECDNAHIDPIHNTLTRAYAAFAAATGYAPGLRVCLQKGIPAGAGLGGGSADAAAIIRYLNTHAPVPLAQQALHSLAVSIGADVPFFLYNVPSQVRGIGDDIRQCTLSSVRAFVGLTLLCLCAPLHVSTAWAYGAWDAAHAAHRDKNTPHSLTMAVYNAKETDSCAQYLVNDFEPVIFARYPQLHTLKEDLLCQGAVSAVMSGSGASVLGLFREADKAHKAYAQALRRGVLAFMDTLFFRP